MSDRRWFIYVLFDPRDGLVRYVGWTVNPTNRLRDHCKPSRLQGRQRRDQWIARLVSDSIKPSMSVIEVGQGDWSKAERRWISYFRFAAADLTNHTDGGQGALGRPHTAAARAAMSKKRKGRKPHPNSIKRTIELNKGTKRPPSWGAKIGDALRGKSKTKEHCKALSAAAYRRGKSRDQTEMPL